MSKASLIDISLDTSNLDPKQKDLLNKPQLDKFIDTHCVTCHYTLQVEKFGADVWDLSICKQPRLPTSFCSGLSWLPDPMPDDDNPGHYMP